MSHRATALQMNDSRLGNAPADKGVAAHSGDAQMFHIHVILYDQCLCVVFLFLLLHAKTLPSLLITIKVITHDYSQFFFTPIIWLRVRAIW